MVGVFAGIHRIQEVSGNKRHTSIVTIAIIEDKLESWEISESDVKYEAYRGSGPGGQSRNKVSTAVRATHLPTATTVYSEDSKSQYINKQNCFSKLRQQILQNAQSTSLAKTNDSRTNQLLELAWNWNGWRDEVLIPGYGKYKMSKMIKGKFPF